METQLNRYGVCSNGWVDLKWETSDKSELQASDCAIANTIESESQSEILY